LNRGGSTLSSLTDNLHDVVPLTLIVEVLTNELKRVVQGGQGSLAHLTLMHTKNKRREKRKRMMFANQMREENGDEKHTLPDRCELQTRQR